MKPPIVDKLPEFRFPETETILLSDGTPLYLVEDLTQPVVSVKLTIKRGAAQESIPGLCSLTAQLLTKGTEKRSAVQIADEVEFMGASLNCAGSWDETSISVHCLDGHLENMLEIMADCLCNSVIAPDELERSRKKNISAVLQDQSDPGYLSSVSFAMKYFEGHPYGHPLAGTPESLGRIDVSDCTDWYSQLKSTPRAVFAAGNFDKNQLVATLEDLIVQRLPVPVKGSSSAAKENRPKGTNIVALDKPDSQQVSLRIAFPVPGRSHPDYSIIQLINTVYGGFFLSRLNSLLREKLGYTYGVGSSINSRLLGTYLSVSTKINDTATKDSIEKTLDELRRISLYPIEKEEHSRAIQYITGSFVRSIETPQQIGNFLYILDLSGLQPDYYNEYYRRLSQSQPDEILAVQKNHFLPESILVSVVGNFANFIDEVSKLGATEKFGSIEDMYKKYI